MKINVTENKVSIKEEQILNENEYNIHKIQFDFSSEYTDDLVKVALFSIDNHTYKKIISNNECDIPPEVLTQRGYSILGVYAYKTEQDTLVLRYSPSPTRISVYDGSYKANAENSEPITPSEIEQYQQILQNSLQQFQNQYNTLVEETEGDIQAIEDELQRKVDEGYFDGEDGYTPQKGVDYFTNEDIQEIEGDILDDVYTKEQTNTLLEGKADIEDIPDVSSFITKDVNNLTNYTLKTNTGSLIDLEINDTTYVVTLKLKNQDGTVISTDTIDLPLESVVVSGRYDNTTKKVILTLENGSEVDFSVADLVAGLQTEITSQNKLASDLVDDTNSGNKFVTTTEKQTWNNKLDESDLEDYVKNTDYATNSKGGVIKTNANYGTNVDSNGSLRGTTKTYADYDSMHDLGLISKVTLENVIAGKGLVSDTDYAGSNKVGVIRTNTDYGTSITSVGALISATRTYQQYLDAATNNMFISKGTLENVIAGKDLVSNTDYATSATGGVIRTGASYGTTMASGGILRAASKTYEDYSSAGDYMFVGKGTLENVIEGKGLATKSDIPKYYHGTCATAAATREKEVECEGFVLEDGATISVLFTNAQAYNGYPYLNVNDTGNIPVLYKGSSAGIRYMWSPGEIIDFTYHNNYWICHGRALATTTYYGVTKLATSATSTSDAFALTPKSLNSFAQGVVANYPVYSTSGTYEVGDRVRYGYGIYECITAIPVKESWTAEHWTPVKTLQEQIDTLEARIKDLENSLQNN